MSLSQKHSGKVLVPWFNILEWKHVYDLIYSENSQDWPKALKILQIWKHRTPLLSAGVEGTLIILEALLVRTSQLSSYEISHIYSTSLVRFLNLCAANSDKQGTFYKTAMKNELPKWLINLRHDIAHSHKVPSESMLLIGIQFCLDWLKVKYWDVQCENMTDFIVDKVDDGVVKATINAIQHLNNSNSIHENVELMKCISKVTNNGHKKLKKSSILEIIENKLTEMIMINKDETFKNICDLLISEDGYILSLQQGEEESEKRLNKLPPEFSKKWGFLLNILYETQLLPKFVYKLFSVVCDEKYNSKAQEIASLWIKEIFSSLLHKENGNESETYLFSSSKSNNCMKIKDFAVQVLHNLSSFTMNFLEEVLQYNNANAEFIDDSVCLVSTFDTKVSVSNDKIFSIEDLNFSANIALTDEIDKKVVKNPSKSRWALIEDASSYMNCPLGVLPHQSRHSNPVLETY